VSLVPTTSFADALIDPMQNQVGDLQVILVLHNHVAVAVNASIGWVEHLRLTSSWLHLTDELLTAIEGLLPRVPREIPVSVSR